MTHIVGAAYSHVVACALMSVLAMAALHAGRYLGWTLLHGTWAMSPNSPICPKNPWAVERPGDERISDQHIWRIVVANPCRNCKAASRL